MNPDECESEWILTKIPDEERQWAAIWEYGREWRELREVAERYRTEYWPAHEKAFDMVSAAQGNEVNGSPEETEAIRMHLDSMVDLQAFDRAEEIVGLIPGVWECVLSDGFPNTPWLELPASVKKPLLSERETGTETVPLIDDCRHVGYLMGPPVRLICDLGDDGPLPPLWFANVKRTFAPNFRNLAVHVSLGDKAEDAVESFRSLFLKLQADAGLSRKSKMSGRLAMKEDFFAHSGTLLKQLGALRLHSMTKGNTCRLEQCAGLLGYKSVSGDLSEHRRQISRTVSKAADKAARHFQEIFGPAATMIHGPTA